MERLFDGLLSICIFLENRSRSAAKIRVFEHVAGKFDIVCFTVSYVTLAVGDVVTVVRLQTDRQRW